MYATYKKNYNRIISANILPIVIQASQIAVNSKFVLGWHGTYCRLQIIGLGFVVKYTYAQGLVTKSEDMPRPDARGRGRGRRQHVEAEVEAEDKISASRTVWPRGLNITAQYNMLRNKSTTNHTHLLCFSLLWSLRFVVVLAVFRPT